MDAKQKTAFGAAVAMVPGGFVILAVGAVAFFAGRAIVRSMRKDQEVRKDLVELALAERLENAYRRYPDPD